MNICYLDNAATTFPKPVAVRREMDRCIATYCGNPGRGSHRMALMSSEAIYEARSLACRLFGSEDTERAVLTMNATHALNIAIMGLLNEGDHVLISDLEHNSVLRPVVYLAKTRGVEFSIFQTKGDILDNVKRLIKKNTRAVICTHQSNITNIKLPVEELGKMLYRLGILFIVDASQSAGSCKIDMTASRISVLCTAGHKGLLGPQGTGLCIFSSEIMPFPLMHGGSGSDSRSPEMPEVLPDRFEAGTMNTPGAAGLSAGISYVLKTGEENIRKKESALIEKIRAHYMGNKRIKEYSEGEGAIWLFNIKGVSSQKTAEILDKHGVCVRPGLHCAPLAHMTLGTPKDGAVRVSTGPLTTEADVNRFIDALDRVLAKV